MGLSLLEEFDALVTSLRTEGVEYAVVGALAVAVHGAPRATTDIDLLVRPEGLAAAGAVAHARGFTPEALPLRFRDGMELRRRTKIRDDDHLTLDLLLVNATLEPVWESRERVETRAGPVTVVGREALIAMKLAAGRAQGIADVERLRELDR